MPTRISNSPARKPRQNLDSLDRVDVAVQIAHFQPDIAKIIGQILGGSFGQGGNQDALVLFHPLAAKLDRVIDLVFQRLDRDLWIKQTGRANDLLDHQWRARRVHVEFFRRLIGL